MKKTFLILIILLISTGCNNISNKKDSNEKSLKNENIIICEMKNDQKKTQSDYTINSTYKIYSSDKIVTKVVTSEVVTSNNSEILNYFDQYLNKTYTELNNNYSGYKFQIKKEDNKIISEVNVDYSVMDMNKYSEDYPDIKTYLNVQSKLTIEKAKKIYENMGANCKDN